MISFFAHAEIEIETSSGIVDGYKKGRVIYWDDIPYAKPPIGQLRWKAPRTINNTKNIILPKENNYCVQRPSSLGGPGGEGLFVGTEDCLYLDISAPVRKKSELLPVMFWIHGGGNTSGLKDLYDFNKMVKKHNVIVVRINYRLGPFGWFYHPSIQDFQTDIDKTSNFGTLDIIAALNWVKKNIIHFGGDPNNITIFGESAGGHNVFSLLVSNKSKGLFHKAISMSGYTTTIKPQDAYIQNKKSSTSSYTSSEIIKKIIKELDEGKEIYSNKEIRDVLLSLTTKDFFKHYADREPYEEIPLLTSDNIVIPQIGLRAALYEKEFVNNVPTIAGSNRDEVKLWLASAEYFVELEYSAIGSALKIPNVRLKDKEAFEAFNYYRSSAWKIRGVDVPLKGLHTAGNNDLYAYRYDWDDHRRYVVADFKELIGAAHATEIPLLAGNAKLVGGYPLSDLIYPAGKSKFYLSRNMMRFWANFAKYGEPGKSTNSVSWEPIVDDGKLGTSFILLDSKQNLKNVSNSNTFKSLAEELYLDERVNDLEKCVILLQMFTFVGNDLYDENIKYYPGKCDRSL
ncbi:carboxylesterase family protein, partial [Gammaproteobacteria bacterium]|nr:carboxylesterase family protein [Gammaproteobacteria bacterium]